MAKITEALSNASEQHPVFYHLPDYHSQQIAPVTALRAMPGAL
ncbi:hypothetical protein [Photorhabdus temperata]|nr:hypothetical protein [Photorhabdus temperata]